MIGSQFIRTFFMSIHRSFFLGFQKNDANFLISPRKMQLQLQAISRSVGNFAAHLPDMLYWRKMLKLKRKKRKTFKISFRFYAKFCEKTTFEIYVIRCRIQSCTKNIQKANPTYYVFCCVFKDLNFLIDFFWRFALFYFKPSRLLFMADLEQKSHFFNEKSVFFHETKNSQHM